MTSEVPTLIVRLRANAAALDATTAMRTTVVHLREAADALEAQSTELALCKTRARWVQVVVAELNADLDLAEAERDAALATILFTPRDAQPAAETAPNPIGWIIVDKITKSLKWDGELHFSKDRAMASLLENIGYRDDEWKPFELYDICAVYLGEQP